MELRPAAAGNIAGITGARQGAVRRLPVHRPGQRWRSGSSGSVLADGQACGKIVVRVGS